MTRCVQANEVWTSINQFQKTYIDAKSRQLRWELKCITKGKKTIMQYLGRIQEINDILESIGYLVSQHDQLELALDV